MHAVPHRIALLVGLLAAVTVVPGCRGGLLGPQYEYEEEMRLDVDGSARLDVNASIQALAALRGLEVAVDSEGEVDREKLRALFQGAGVEVTSVRTSRRSRRLFVHVRLQVDDVRQLSRLTAFAWSTYQFDRRGGLLEYRQQVGPPVGRAVPGAGWDGSELVAFRMHIPSVIVFHNTPSKVVERGNILEWEQPLTERLKGTPVDVQVNMERESILYSTLILFASTIVAAAAAFAFVIWRVMRHGRDEDAPAITG
jgi:hypothetical protein